MSSTRTPFQKDPQAGYFSLVGGFKGVGLYSLLAIAFADSIIFYDAAKALSFLILPLVLGLASIIGLIFRYRGVVTAFIVILTVGLALKYTDMGIFADMSLAQGLLFVVGMAGTAVLFSMISALAVGYNRIQSELANNRQNLLHKVFDALPIGIWVRARDGRTVFINDRWAEFSPDSAEAIVASGRTEPPVELGADWNELFERVIDTNDTSVHYKNIELKNSGGVPSNMTLLTLRMFIDQEEDFGTLSLLVDETAIRAYEAKIQQSERNLQLALHNAQMGFWTANVKTNQMDCDENWYQLLEASRDTKASPAVVWNERLHPEDAEAVGQRYRDFLDAGAETCRLDYRIRKGDAEYIWVQDSILVTERSEDGSTECIMGTMQNITEQKNSEMELMLAKERAETANLAKGQFIATISHEIRTPLNAIIGLSSFLIEGDMDEDYLDLARTIHGSGKNLLTLVNEILDFSKIEAGRLRLEMQEFPIKLCLEESVKLFGARASEKGVDLRLELADDLPEFAFGDMERFRRILQNLLSNAVKFTDEGAVTLSARIVGAEDLSADRCPRQIESAVLDDDTESKLLEIRVKDSGIGIAEEHHPLLFKAFSQVDSSATRKYEGTGLGLVISKRLVDAMGGRIWAESADGKGAEFCFVLKMRFVPEKSAIPSAERVSVSQREGKLATRHPLDILIVGNDESARELFQLCREFGYLPHHTSDFDLSGSAFERRNYDLLLVVVDDEPKALELVRNVTTSGYVMRPEKIVGFAPAGKEISIERCRLGGLENVFREMPAPEQLKDIITSVLNARG